MNNAEPIIFGSASMHGRLCLVTEVLGAFVSSAPRGVRPEQLARDTGRPEKELIRLCNALCREGLLQPLPEQPNSWRLACEASRITLEDAFRFVVNEQAARDRARRGDTRQDGGRREVDLLIMQATMSINQSVLQHLRQFSLDRLKVAATGMFPPRRAVEERAFDWPARHLSFS